MADAQRVAATLAIAMPASTINNNQELALKSSALQRVTLLWKANSSRGRKANFQICSRFAWLWRHNKPGARMQAQPGAKASKRRSDPCSRLRIAAVAPPLYGQLVHQGDLKWLARGIAPLRALELKASAVEETQRRGFAGVHERGDSLDPVRLEGMCEQRLDFVFDGRRKPHRLTKRELSALVWNDADKLRKRTPVRVGQYSIKLGFHDEIDSARLSNSILSRFSQRPYQAWLWH